MAVPTFLRWEKPKACRLARSLMRGAKARAPLVYQSFNGNTGRFWEPAGLETTAATGARELCVAIDGDVGILGI